MISTPQDCDVAWNLNLKTALSNLDCVSSRPIRLQRRRMVIFHTSKFITTVPVTDGARWSAAYETLASWLVESSNRTQRSLEDTQHKLWFSLVQQFQNYGSTTSESVIQSIYDSLSLKFGSGFHFFTNGSVEINFQIGFGGGCSITGICWIIAWGNFSYSSLQVILTGIFTFLYSLSTPRRGSDPAKPG